MEGLQYSIDTRVVEMGSGPRVLQVRLLYSEGGKTNISPTPGWSGTVTRHQLHPGGKEIKLDVRTARMYARNLPEIYVNFPRNLADFSQKCT